MIFARFHVSTTTDMDVCDSLICGKYYIFCCKSLTSGDSMAFQPTHIGVFDTEK